MGTPICATADGVVTAAGWIEPRGHAHGALLEQVDGQAILQLCVERKPVPASVVKNLLEERAGRIERVIGTGCPCGRFGIGRHGR